MILCDWSHDCHVETPVGDSDYHRVDFFCYALQVRYLHDFADRLELNVQFQNEITEITRDRNETGMFQLRNQNGTSYSCRVVIIRFGFASFIPADMNLTGMLNINNRSHFVISILGVT